ncbi:UNVERIFIED_CONTAM: hypothetical protein GTU68_031065, partial [Idotea baltica]|nr:hypothetical protein [Idotea baltica]
LTVLNRRFPAVNVIVYPVAVQGTDSANQIAKAIATAMQRQECDVLILSRGGGSLEDLWSFNEEKVAQAIFGCDIPIISAVGHEVDFTIADFVADMRAATPSAAAELAVPDAQQWLQQLKAQCRRLTLLMTHAIQNQQRHLSHLMRRIPLKHPQAKIDVQQATLTQLQTRLRHVMTRRSDALSRQYQQLNQRLALKSPLPMLTQQQHDFAQLQARLHVSMRQALASKQAYFKQQIRTLSAVSPLNTLERGYSIATDKATGHVLSNAQSVSVGQQVNVKLQQGQLVCQVQETKDD